MNKLRLLKSAARHLAAAQLSDLGDLPNRCLEELLSSIENAPKRHRDQFKLPAKDLLFSLKQLNWNDEDQRALILVERVNSFLRDTTPSQNSLNSEANMAAALSKFQPVTSSSSTNNRRLRSRYFESEEMPVDLANLNPSSSSQIPDSSPFDAATLLAEANCNYSLPDLVAKLNTRNFELPPQDVQEFLNEIAWLDSVSSHPPNFIDRSRLVRLALIANQIGHHLYAQNVNVPPKRRRVDQTTQSLPNRHNQHAGTVDTIWESLEVRKHLRVDQVERLLKLHRALTQVAAKVPQPNNLESFALMNIRDWDAAGTDKNCGLCGMRFSNSAEKSLHLKCHVFRAAPVYNAVFNHRGSSAGVSLPLPPWMDFSNVKSFTTTARHQENDALSDILNILRLPHTEETSAALTPLLSRGTENQSQAPATSRGKAYLVPISDFETKCPICERDFEITFLLGRWWAMSAVLVSKSPTDSWIAAAHVHRGTSSSSSFGENSGAPLSQKVDLLVGGEAGSKLRRSMGGVYLRARDTSRPITRGPLLALRSALRRVLEADGFESMCENLHGSSHLLESDVRMALLELMRPSVQNPAATPLVMNEVENDRLAIVREMARMPDLPETSNGLQVHWQCLPGG